MTRSISPLEFRLVHECIDPKGIKVNQSVLQRLGDAGIFGGMTNKDRKVLLWHGHLKIARWCIAAMRTAAFLPDFFCAVMPGTLAPVSVYASETSE
jgi:hypothetical protein